MKTVEFQAKELVCKLKYFYIELSVYMCVNIILFLLWSIFVNFYFWPIFLTIGWGVGLIFQSFSLGLIPFSLKMLPFLNSDWESLKISKILKDLNQKVDK